MDYTKKFLKYQYKVNKLLQYGGSNINDFKQNHLTLSNSKLKLENDIYELEYKLNNNLQEKKLKNQIQNINTNIDLIKKNINILKKNKSNNVLKLTNKISEIKIKISKNPDDEYLQFLLQNHESKLDNLKNNNKISELNSLLDSELKLLDKYQKKLDNNKTNKNIIKEKIKKLDTRLETFIINSREKNILFENFEELNLNPEILVPKLDNLENFIYFINNTFNKTIDSMYGNFNIWEDIVYQLGYRYSCNELLEIYTETNYIFKEIYNIFEIPNSFIYNFSNNKVGKYPVNKLNAVYSNNFLLDEIPTEIEKYLNNSKKIIIDLNTIFPGKVNFNNNYDLTIDYFHYKNYLSIFNDIEKQNTLFLNFTNFHSSFGAALLYNFIDFKFHFPKEIFYTKNRISILNQLQDLNYSWLNKNITNVSCLGIMLCCSLYYNYESENGILPINFDLLPNNFDNFKKIIIFTEDEFTKKPINYIYNSIIYKNNDNKIFKKYLNNINIPITIYGIKEFNNDNLIKYNFNLEKK
jgi:hypothetical protein